MSSHLGVDTSGAAHFALPAIEARALVNGSRRFPAVNIDASVEVSPPKPYVTGCYVQDTTGKMVLVFPLTKDGDFAQISDIATFQATQIYAEQVFQATEKACPKMIANAQQTLIGTDGRVHQVRTLDSSGKVQSLVLDPTIATQAQLMTKTHAFADFARGNARDLAPPLPQQMDFTAFTTEEETAKSSCLTHIGSGNLKQVTPADITTAMATSLAKQPNSVTEMGYAYADPISSRNEAELPNLLKAYQPPGGGPVRKPNEAGYLENHNGLAMIPIHLPKQKRTVGLVMDMKQKTFHFYDPTGKDINHPDNREALAIAHRLDRRFIHPPSSIASRLLNPLRNGGIAISPQCSISTDTVNHHATSETSAAYVLNFFQNMAVVPAQRRRLITTDEIYNKFIAVTKGTAAPGALPTHPLATAATAAASNVRLNAELRRVLTNLTP